VTEHRAAAARAALAGGAVFVVLGLVLVGALAALLVPDFTTLRSDEDLLGYERRTTIAVLLAGALAAVPAGAATSLLAARDGLGSRALVALAAPLLLGALYLLGSDLPRTAQLVGIVLLPLAALIGHGLAERLAAPSTPAPEPRPPA